MELPHLTAHDKACEPRAELNNIYMSQLLSNHHTEKSSVVQTQRKVYTRFGTGFSLIYLTYSHKFLNWKLDCLVILI